HLRGLDYNNDPVWAFAEGIPDSPWYIVTKMDSDEALAEWRTLSRTIILLLVAAAVGIVAFGLLSWQAYRTAMFRAASESEDRYRQLFEDSPSSLWEQDMSAVKERLDELQRDGVTDLDAYLRENPDIVTGLIQRIKVLD